MSLDDRYSYTLQSCDAGKYPDIQNLCTQTNPSPFDGQIVYINTAPYGGFNTIDQGRTYLVVANGLNATLCNGFMPPLGSTFLVSCADPNADLLYQVVNCADDTDTRNVLLASSYSIGDVLRFTGECSCWTVLKAISNYDETPTVANTFTNCTECLEEVVGEQCEYGERTIGYAVSLGFPTPEPQDRGFAECCYSNTVLADLASTDSYKNDFTSVFYKRQTPNDTVTYEIIGVSTGTTALVDGVHGTLYAFGGAEQPDLSYFRVEWRDILSTLGEDIYTIRMVQTIAGVVNNVDSIVSYSLKQWSISNADNTVRMDWTMDGKLEKINVDFKNSGYSNSVRTRGYFGDRTPNIEQDNVLYSSKKGTPYYQDQITMSNSFSYVYQANNVPECVARPIYAEGIYGNEIFISDYNTNNHSYLYEVFPVILEDDNGPAYQVKGRGVDINLTFGDRAKDNRKTNC